MEITSEQLAKIRPLNGQVLIHIKMFNNKITFKDGTELALDVSFNPEQHISVSGTVHAVSETMYFNRKKKSISAEWLPEMELRPGDEVYFSYFAALMALGLKANEAADFTNDRWIEVEGSLYIFVNYTEIFFKASPDSAIPVVMLNGYVLGKPVNMTNLDEGSIKIPEWVKDKMNLSKNRFSEILATGKPNIMYLEEKKKDVVDVRVGDIVMFSKYANETVENRLHQKIFPDVETYNVIQRFRIKMIFRGEKYKKAIEEGVLK